MILVGWIVYTAGYVDNKVYLDKEMAEKRATEIAVEYNLGKTGYAMFSLKQLEIVPVDN